MRRFLSALTLVAALPLVAQDSPRFAVFSPDQLREISVRAKKVFAEAEALQKNLESQEKARVEELQKLDQQLKSPSLSDEGRAKLQRELQDNETTYKRWVEDSQKTLRAAGQKAIGAFQTEVGPIVQEVAKEMKLQAVFQLQQGLLAYADETWIVTFTTEVAKRYDAKFESGAAAAAPAAPKPAPKAGKKG